MPIIEPKDKSLKTLNGMHLWHARMSSCSQRVRIILAEVDMPYHSHLIDLERNEHATDAYQAIHPNGVVPAFVDNGTLIIESIDIIKHIARVTGFSLGSDPDQLLELANDAQVDLKLLTYEFLFRGTPRPQSINDGFQKTHDNEWLKKFRQDFARGFAKERIDVAVTRTYEGFNLLDNQLSDGRPYLCGTEYSLADIAWMPNVHRMHLMGWPYRHTPFLELWFQRLATRDSYDSALVSWQNEDAIGRFETYTNERRKARMSVEFFGVLANYE